MILRAFSKCVSGWASASTSRAVEGRFFPGARGAGVWLALASLFFAGAAFGQSQTLLKELGDGQATTVETGEHVVYVVRGSCSSLTADCGKLTLTDILRPELELVSCSAAGGYFDAPGGSLTCPAGGDTVVAVRDTFMDGDTYVLTITTRVRLDLTAGAAGIDNTAVAGIRDEDCGLNPGSDDCRTSTADPVDIPPPDADYRVRKQRIDPAKAEADNGNPTASLQIAAGTWVRYRVQFCSNSATGNLALTAPVTLTDTFTSPAGNPTTVLNDGGGVVAGNTITWELSDQSELDALLGTTGCISREFVLEYDSGLALGDDVNNTVKAEGTNVNGGDLGPGPLEVTVLDKIGESDPGATVSKAGNDATPSGADQVTWRLGMNNTDSNVPMDDFVVVDYLPLANPPSTSGPLKVATISSGTWPHGNDWDYNVVADIYTATSGTPGTCDGANVNWVLLANNVASSINAGFVSPGDFNEDIRAICWRFHNTDPLQPPNQVPRSFGFLTSPTIVQDVLNTTPIGIVQNCVEASWTDPVSATTESATHCRNQNIESPTPAIKVRKTRISPNTGSLEPLDEFGWRLTFSHINTDSTGPITNPTVADLLPENLEFVGWTNYQGPGGKAEPNLEVIDDYNGTSRTLLRFTWAAAAPAGSVKRDGTPGVNNPEQFETTIAEGQMPRMDIRVRVRAGIAPGNGSTNSNYRNQVLVFDNGPGDFTCESVSDTHEDTHDLNGDGATTSTCGRNANYTVVIGGALVGEKWVRGDGSQPNVDDPTDAVLPPGGVCPDYEIAYPTTTVGPDYTRFPCVAQTDHGSTFDYVIRIQNASNQEMDEYILYDVLPFVGDVGAGELLSTTGRDTRWRPVMTGPIDVIYADGIPDFEIEYSTAAPGTMCRPRAAVTSGANTYTRGDLATLDPELWQPGCDDTFTATPADWADVTGFRIRAFADGVNRFQVLAILELGVKMTAPLGMPPSIATNPAIFNPAWNSFAHAAFIAGTPAGARPLETAEPRKVGVILPERYRLGNLIWMDLNQDGIADDGEPGINGVEVSLCDASDDLIATTTTATVDGHPGKYFFDTLEAGQYYIAIADNQPALAGYWVTGNPVGDPTATEVDNDNNGDTPGGATCVGGGAAIASTGLMTLGPRNPGDPADSEPTNEVLRDGSLVDDDDDYYPDAMSNYTLDIGFAPPVDFGDLPDDGTAATGTGNYLTLLANDGPRHVIRDGLYLGSCVDAETDGQPGVNADGDDTSGASAIHTQGACAAAGDDEDGLDVNDLVQYVGGATVLHIDVTNSTADDAQLCVFVDWNRDGSFAGNVGGTPEVVAVAVPASTAGTVNADFGTLAQLVDAGDTYARIRLSTDLGACTPDGVAPDGEVEDYLIQVLKTDLGDLPDTGVGTGPGNYNTLLTSGGPVHNIVPGLHLGANVDAEPDGQPSVNADGDDLNGVPDDEDGVNTIDLSNLHRGSPALVRVEATNTTGNAAKICGFIDFNGDGDFDDASERAEIAVPDGSNGVEFTLNFGNVPNDATMAQTYARFRLSTDAGACAPDGSASDGEVEDYTLQVLGGEMSLGDLVWVDTNNNGVVDPSEVGLPNVQVDLYLDPDDPPIATRTTDASGNYLFDGLVPEDYVVCIVAPIEYVTSTGSGFPYQPGPYEPAPAPDRVNDHDNGTASPTAGEPTRICSGTVTLEFGMEPAGPGNNHNPTIDFGLLLNFDLELKKELAAGQSPSVPSGSNVTFTITLTNEGTATAANILVVDRLPAGLELDDPAWTDLGGGEASYLFVGPLLPGESASIDITVKLSDPPVYGPLENIAEIARAEDQHGNEPIDIDSTPDNDDDGEDDQDAAVINVVDPPLFVPVGGPVGLAILVLMLGLIGLRARAARAVRH